MGTRLSQPFFSCPFSRLIWQQICSLSGISKVPEPWNAQIAWLGKFQDKVFDSSIRKLAWAAMVYYIQKERNCRVFQGICRPSSFVLQKIMFHVRIKGSQFQNVQDSPLNIALCQAAKSQDFFFFLLLTVVSFLHEWKTCLPTFSVMVHAFNKIGITKNKK